jgi:hypothetical protein
VLGAGIAVFSINYYLGENSQFLIDRDRSNYFAEHCDEAMEVIYEPAENVHGIYFSPDWGAGYGRSKFGKYSGSQVGVLGLGFLNSGTLPFYEVDNDKKDVYPYKRYYRGDFRGEKVSTIASNYSVITENLSKGLRPELGIYFAHITIISSDKNKTIAEAKYLVSSADHRICLPNPEKGFSTLQFAYQTFKSVMKSSFDNGKR